MPDEDERRIPLAAETAHIEKREVETGRVRVSTRTEAFTETVRAELDRQVVEVTRVAVGREITEVPQVRTEGTLTVLPVVEEILVVEKRLVLKEELHIRFRSEREKVEAPVELRRQVAEVTRD
jgi:stress response protein YsnF